MSHVNVIIGKYIPTPFSFKLMVLSVTVNKALHDIIQVDFLWINVWLAERLGYFKAKIGEALLETAPFTFSPFNCNGFSDWL